MDSQDPDEAQRHGPVKECLENSIIDPSIRDETEEYLEGIWMLGFGNHNQAIVELDTFHSKTGNAFVEPQSTIEVLTPSPSPTYRGLFKIDTSQPTVVEDRNLVGITKLLTPAAEERMMDWGYFTGVLQVESNIRGTPGPFARACDFDNSIQNLPTNKDSPKSAYHSTKKNPAAPDPIVMGRLKNLDEIANWGSFHALLDVVSTAIPGYYDSRDGTIIEKFEVAGVPLQVGTQDRNPSAKRGKRESIAMDSGAVPEWNGPTTPAARSRRDIVKKIQEQIRRSGMLPVTALGALPGTPSSKTQYQHLFLPDSTLPSNQEPKSSLVSPPISLEEIGYDSDKTIPDPNWSQSESDSEILPGKKPKKQVQFQYNGPPAFLLDPSRTDAVAIAAKTNNLGDLNDFSSILGSDSICSTRLGHSNVNRSPRINDSNSGVTGSNFVNYSPRLRGSRLGVCGGGSVFIEEPILDRRNNYERLKAERQIRDDNELYIGLKNYPGQQRGWNREHESIRRAALNEYHLQEERTLLAKCEKDKAAKKGKDPTTPRKQRPQLDNSSMSREDIITAQAKHLEDGYSELYAYGIQSSVDYDDILDENERENHRKMLSRHWDADEIKREVLEEQRAKVNAILPSLNLRLK